jgi:S-adenosylmethionine:diacylglycerol 3-amino-3-carboxypropyl transferase
LQKSLTELAQRLTGASPTLAELDPATKAALAAISAAEQARLQEQFDRESGDLLARLYGSGVQRSSIAGENLSQMLQAQNLVTQQQQSDAATRELQAREYLTNVGQQSNNSLLGLLNSLLGQQTQRDIATGGLNLDSAKLAEQARQFGLNSELAQQDADLRLAAARRQRPSRHSRVSRQFWPRADSSPGRSVQESPRR